MKAVKIQKSEYQYIAVRPFEMIKILTDVKNNESYKVFKELANQLLLYILSNKKKYSAELMASMVNVIMKISEEAISRNILLKALMLLESPKYELARNIMKGYI